MRKLRESIEKLGKENKQAVEEILEKMQPLAKKYARKIHFQEYEDSLQEMNLALLEAIPHLSILRSEGENLKYLQAAVMHRYFFLCKKEIPYQYMERIDFEKNRNKQKSDDISFVENKLDAEYYIRILYEKYPKQAQILYDAVFLKWTDQKIAENLNVSRQYVNRIKHQHLKKILDY